MVSDKDKSFYNEGVEYIKSDQITIKMLQYLARNPQVSRYELRDNVVDNKDSVERKIKFLCDIGVIDKPTTDVFQDKWNFELTDQGWKILLHIDNNVDIPIMNDVKPLDKDDIDSWKQYIIMVHDLQRIDNDDFHAANHLISIWERSQTEPEVLRDAFIQLHEIMKTLAKNGDYWRSESFHTKYKRLVASIHLLSGK